MKPSKKAIDKAHTGNVDTISYTTLEGMIAGAVMPEFASFEPQPELGEYLQGSTPPKIQRDKNFPRTDPMETEETAAAKVTFTGVTVRKRKEVSTPEGTPERPNLVTGSVLLGKKGILDATSLRKNKCKYVSVVHAPLRVPHGDVKNLVMDLMFMGLNTLRAEDKSVCFLHPNNPSQRAKARKDMPVKFQKIHEEWMVFDQPIGRFKNDIKEGHTCTYNVSVWLGSELPAKKILEQCTLEWEETRSNGGTIKMVYKQVQSLYTARNLILVGVPTDLDAEALQTVLKDKMEEAHRRMVVKNPYKYGSITKVPQFILEKDFIKHTLYSEQSNEDDIPFWVKMPFHLEYLKTNEDELEHILAFMYRTKRFQGLFGEASFYHQIPGMDSTAGEREILAGVLMRHIAMVQSTSRVLLKGLAKPDRPHILYRLDEEDPDKIDIKITRTVREIMMEKKIQGSNVWILIGQLADGRWAGYFRYGIGNDPHQAHAVEWAGAVSSHIRYHLLRQGFEPKGVNNLVQGSFNLQATKEAAEAVQDSDGRIKTRSQAAAEQALQLHNKLHSSWVDITLGMTKLQREEHARQLAMKASAQNKTDGLDRNYNFEETHSIDPIDGRTNNGTALTKTINTSLGETA